VSDVTVRVLGQWKKDSIMPKVSIICASYNHERYVRSFLESVLAQTDPEWELIIVDDSSKDGNVSVIREFDDPRIHLVCHEWNRGINQGLMDAFRMSEAPIIQFFASDDQMFSDDVATLCATFSDPSVDIVCAPLSYMDADGKDLGVLRSLPVSLSREKLLFEMVLGEDCLPSPGMAMRRECYSSIMPLDVSLLQLQDWETNLRLLARYNVRMLDRPLVHYRRGHAEMTSAPSRATALRRDVEIGRLMNRACELFSRDAKLFARCFGDHFGQVPQPIGSEDVPFLLARLAVSCSDLGRQLGGLQKMLACLSTEEGFATLHARFGFEYSDYMRLTKRLTKNRQMSAEDEDRTRLEKKLGRYQRRFRLSLFCLAVLGGLVLAQMAWTLFFS